MKNLYFVVEPSQIVAQDLAHAIHIFDPDAQVRIFPRLTGVQSALDRPRPVAVFLYRDPRTEMTLQVTQALLDAGIPFAFIGGEADDQPEGAGVLASPFTEVTVASLLRRLLGQVSESEGEDA